jgi:hypothetical protein
MSFVAATRLWVETAKGVPLSTAPEPSTTVLVIGSPIAPSDVPELCERLRMLLVGAHADLVVCDVRALVDPDTLTVEALARLQLTARRLGSEIRLSHAPPCLQDLLAFVGLSAVVPPHGATTRAGVADRRAGTGSSCPGRT